MIRVTIEVNDTSKGMSEDTQSEDLTSAVECCEKALMAAGFCFHGHLDLVKDE